MPQEDKKKRRKRTKAAGSTGRATSGRATQPTTSPRYTPPIPQSYRTSPKWVPILMFGLFIVGVAVILLNYLPGAPLLPGDTSNWYLLIGLGCIAAGFLVSTKLH